MTDQPPRGSETPRNEPEIFPPGTPIRPRRTDAFDEPLFTQRITIARLGPFSLILLALAIVIIVAIALILLVGAFLLWIPVVIFVIAVAITSGALRSHFRRPR